ncbi:81b079d0-adcc-48ba-8edc-a0b0d8a4237d [Sclerotinia trifoliorum]|uniref:81b079d0-adcc-48ba-8edc-a0b0d8a4237d n=1 Tax=Sclerotinia trifoliorum TaxID=28548 RepID=A0A8H2VPL8_9HELO|nr:81b079d0-adcc-48ba-8edc-a0b0d8a4237d [Sclerotinia trifoliorum]
MEKALNNRFLTPEEWEDYEENTGVTNPFENVDQEDTLLRLHHSQVSINSPSPRSTSSSNYSTASLSNPSPNFPINSHTKLKASRAPPSPTPSYKSHDPLLSKTSPSLIPSSTSPNQPKTTRMIRLPSRGITHINPAISKNWLPILQSYLSYPFTNPDILEEALETPKNGVTCVGKTRRICMDGNAGMAKLGEMVMRLALREQYYLFTQAAQITNRVLSRHSLNAYPTIASCIRPQPYVPISFRNIIELVKEDTREDSTRAISRAVKAVIGAVYLDGGIESAKEVMENLQMGIKLPSGSRE